MDKSQTINHIAAGLAKFHAAVGKIKKSADNPFFKSKYAPLPDILEAIAEPLQTAGLTFAQFPDGDSLTTVLMHVESGEWMQASYAMHPVKSDPQSVGSAITYARRYALAAILGLNVDEDDDGNKASQPTAKADKPEDNRPWLNENNPSFKTIKDYLNAQPENTRASVLKKYEEKFKISKAVREALLS